jgi:hypothetical protein
MNIHQEESKENKDMATIGAIKAAAGFGTKRVIYSCKKCGTTIARDYMRQDGNLKLFRLEGDRVIWQEQDMQCTCKGGMYPTRFKATFVQATLNEKHTCDARCVNAKGQDCTCSCGGENHGKAFLI